MQKYPIERDIINIKCLLSRNYQDDSNYQSKRTNSVGEISTMNSDTDHERSGLNILGKHTKDRDIRIFKHAYVTKFSHVRLVVYNITDNIK